LFRLQRQSLINRMGFNVRGGSGEGLKKMKIEKEN
jgi:hypothetical protein